MNAGTIQLARSSGGRREPVDREITIRSIDPADGAGLSDFYARLNPRSARQRFLGAPPREPEVLSALADAAGVVAVLSERGPRDGEIVAHASIHPDGRGGAEIAFAVADELHGQGIGSRLMVAILARARRMGLHRVGAVLYVDNVPMRKLLVHSGRAVTADALEAGTEEITLDLDRAA
ncbi:MAG TPA: GNAT family N-acetyltransferase [Candidatus Limnocylindria bacterium]|nr:GNAT family N-acetyltransferase [Candidatus Limnocylindria bacterium]